jgi:hypothetical protein
MGEEAVRERDLEPARRRMEAMTTDDPAAAVAVVMVP